MTALSVRMKAVGRALGLSGAGRVVRHVTASLMQRLRASLDNELHLFRDGGLGDVLMCTAVLRAYKARHPRHKTYFYTDYADVVAGLPYIDVVGSSAARPKRAVWVDYHYWIKLFPTAHVAKLMGRSLLTPVADAQPECVVDEALAQQYRSRWAELPHPHVLIQRQASAHTPNKNWPEAHWGRLVAMMLERGWTVIEIGERSAATVAHERYVDLRGRTTVKELVASIAAADLFIGPVSGPSHVAAATGTPSVIIVGGYELPENTRYDSAVMLTTPIACSPCWLRTECPIGKQCLQSITPNVVLANATRTLAAAGADRA